MKISILCSDPRHPINTYLQTWINEVSKEHDVVLNRSKKELTEGDVLFLISCNEIIEEIDRRKFTKTLVIHASNLPQGRGWSPHIWQIIEGNSELTVTLLEAEDKVDSGNVWKRINISIAPHELHDEINEKLFQAEIQLMNFAIVSFFDVKPVAQSVDIEPTYYPKRSPEDSRINVHKNLYEQFNLLRVCDPERFPAFFEIHGHKFTLKLEKHGISHEKH